MPLLYVNSSCQEILNLRLYKGGDEMESNEVKTNLLAGVGIVETSLEGLIRDSERLAVIKDYVKSTTYPDRNALLVLTGEKVNENEK